MTIRLAFATDSGYFGPTLLAVASALQYCPPGTEVLFLGTDLTQAETTRLRATVAQFEGAGLRYHPISLADFGDTRQPDPNITLTTLARLFLPRLAKGRVLYIDGDTLIEGPLGDLFHIDMKGYPLAAVRDLFVLRLLLRGKAQAVSYFAAIMGERPVTDYFNSGVLLMDLDAIIADPSLKARMEDFSGMGAYSFLDQDHLNRIFAGRTLFLPHRWNSVWGRVRYQNAIWRKLGLPPSEMSVRSPAIVHFPGRKKPWHKLRFSTVLRGFPAFLRYRRFQDGWAARKLR